MVAVPSIGRADQSLLQRPAPESDATRRLYEQYSRQIHAYCFHQLGNKEEAEDAVQSTFLNAFRGLQRGVRPEFEMAWLYKIAHNVCLTRRRSSTRRRRIESPGDIDALQDVIPAPQVDSDELIGLPEALGDMPKQQQRALLLREWQGLSYREIAAEMNLSQAAVETLLFRARRSLAAGLVEDPKERGFAKRIAKGGDAGSWLTLLKSLLVTGGSKVAATVATVAATSVVATAPVARHAVEHAVSFASADSHRPVATRTLTPHSKPVASHTAAAGALVTAAAVHTEKKTHHAVPSRRAHHVKKTAVFLPKETVGSRSRVVVTGTEPTTSVAAATPVSTPSAPPAAPATPPPAAAPATPPPAAAPATPPATGGGTQTAATTPTNGGTHGGTTGTGGAAPSPTTPATAPSPPVKHGGPVVAIPLTPLQPLPPFSTQPTTTTPTTTTPTTTTPTTTTPTTTTPTTTTPTTGTGGTTPPTTTTSTPPPTSTTPVASPPVTPVIVVLHHR